MSQSRNPGNSWKNKQDFNPRGGAEIVVHIPRVLTGDYQAGLMDHRLGRVRNVQSVTEQTTLDAMDNNDGALVRVGGEIIGRAERFTCELMEPLDPQNQQWATGNSPLIRHNSQRYMAFEVPMRLHGTEPQTPPVRTGIVAGQIPTLAGTVTGTASGTGGTLAATTDYIIKVYKVVLARGERVYGPAALDWQGNYNTGKASSAVTTTGTTSKITVTFDSDGDCNGYIVTLASATLTLTERVVAVGLTGGEAGDGITIVITDPTAMTNAPTMGTQPSTHTTVQNADGTTTYVLDSDYRFNAYDGSLARIEGGDIDTNQEVVLRYLVLLAPSISLKLGKDEAFNVEVAPISLYHLGDDEGRDEVTGHIRTLYNANIRASNWEQAFSEEDWGSVTLTIEGIVRPDPNGLERGFGSSTILSPRFEGVTDLEGESAAMDETAPFQPTGVTDNTTLGFGL